MSIKGKIPVRIAALCGSLVCAAGNAAAKQPVAPLTAAADGQVQASRCAVDAEVVFVLDTTGSMTGLIEGAKQKIWSIAGGIIQKTGGKVSIGLVPYRDIGDEYVTRLFPLTNNLDKVYSDLQGFRAAGGGDMPESVNQALFEAVAKIKWSDSPKVMRTVFLVGDCPPHMDYQDDVKYPDSCKFAAAKNIVINTIQCGNSRSAEPIWRDIANRTNGGYSQIGQSGDMQMASTPYDVDIQKVNIEISRTVLPYGSKRKQAEYKKLLVDNIGASSSVAASRNAVKAKMRRMEAADLAAPVEGQDLTATPEFLGSIAAADLPEELQNLSPEEQRAKLDAAVAKRKELNAKLLELDRKRAEYLLKSAEAKPAGPASFDAEVLKSVEAQLNTIRGYRK